MSGFVGLTHNLAQFPQKLESGPERMNSADAPEGCAWALSALNCPLSSLGDLLMEGFPLPR